VSKISLKEFVYESRCKCGKLLTKPTVKIDMDINNAIVSYGAKTKCRRCKAVHESVRVVDRKDLLVKNQ